MDVSLIEHMGSDLTTVNAARVSFNKESDWENVTGPYSWGEEYDLNEQDVKLIKYLGEHGHISPFGHSFASFRVKAPIFVARQLVKHKFLRWNEISRRYVNYEPEFYEPEEWRARPDASIKQGSGENLEFDPVREFAFYGANAVALDLYNKLLEDGVAPEQARMVLPQNMYTEWWWSGSLDAFAAMCNLRCKPDAQYESRVIADQIDKIMSELYPHSWKALRE